MNQTFEVPQWLDKSFIRRILESKSEKIYTVHKFDVESATKKGDNFLGELARIVVHFSEDDDKEIRTRNMILKKTHTDPLFYDMFSHSEIHKKEINCYRKFIPEFEKLLHSVGIAEKLCPEALYYDIESEVLVMEDLMTSGYRTAEKSGRFSMDVVKMVLRKLVLYHVAAIAYNKESNGQLEKVKNTVFVGNHLDCIFMPCLDAAILEVKSWGAGFQKYVRKLTFLRENFCPIMKATLVPSEGMGVFTHGDLWMNNIMLKFNEDQNEVEDLLLLDLQLSGWASRAIDVIFLIFTSLNEEDYMEKMDEILEYYHVQFTQTMEKFHMKSNTRLEDFRKEVYMKLPYMFMGGLFVKSFVYKDNADVNLFANSTKETLQEQVYKNPRFQNELKYLLRFADEQKVWEMCKEIVDNQK